MATILDIDIDIDIEEPSSFKQKPSDNDLKFGKNFTDRMFVQEYKNNAWQKGKITGFQNFSLSPAAMVFHYGQEIFEGLKAFRQVDDSIVIFRPDQNANRFRNSARRIVMPEVDEEYFVNSISKLVQLENEWVPRKRGTSLYIRPTMIASEAALGVHPAEEYMYYIILSPAGPYFASGFSPTKIKVEDKYVRAANGGTGDAKTGGNYAGSLLAGQIAKKQGYSQVLWLDGNNRKYIEEVGAMNIAFVIDETVVTPPLTGTILPGITRQSVIQLCKDKGIKVEERLLDIETIIETIKSRNLTEIFGIGTAASIAPIGEIMYKEEAYIAGDGGIGPITNGLYNELTGIQYGEIEDRHGWIHRVVDSS